MPSMRPSWSSSQASKLSRSTPLSLSPEPAWERLEVGLGGGGKKWDGCGMATERGVAGRRPPPGSRGLAGSGDVCSWCPSRLTEGDMKRDPRPARQGNEKAPPPRGRRSREARPVRPPDTLLSFPPIGRSGLAFLKLLT